MKNKKVFVSIAGNIGSGKSSLTKLIADEFNWKPYYERVNDNPYLKDFYSDMNRWSFNLQVFFLSHRFKTHIEILKKIFGNTGQKHLRGCGDICKESLPHGKNE